MEVRVIDRNGRQRLSRGRPPRPLLLAATMALAVQAWAAEAPPPATAPAAAQTQAAARASAEIDLFLFDLDSRPLNDFRVLDQDGREYRPAADGLLRFQLPPGTHQLVVERGGTTLASLPLQTQAGELAQILISLKAEGAPSISVESSTGSSTTLSAEPQLGEPGRLSGRIVNADDGKPIVGARVFVSGTPIDLSTDADGRFSAELPPGSYSISVLAPAFATQTLDAVEIQSKDTTERAIELTPAGLELPEFVVVEPFVEGSLAAFVEEKRSSSAVTDILGAEQISRSGDSDAAGALRRVTGLTLVDGKFVYVRGLGERYSSTLLNGAQIPSPDPTRRVVPLDLFPTEILEGIVIQKTYSPDMPAEFGGGTIQLRTRGVPEGFIARAQFTTGYADGTTGSEGITYRGDADDWTGFEGGARELPASIRERISGGRTLRPQTIFNPEGLTPAEFESLGEDLATLGFGQKRSKIDPPLGFAGSLGNVFEVDGVKLGFLSSLRYSNQWDTREEVRRSYIISAGNLAPRTEQNRTRTDQNIELSGFLNLGVEFGEDHKLKATSVLVRQSNDRSDFSEGFDGDPEDFSRFYKLEWIENDLFSQQISGTHVIRPLRDLALDWQYTKARAERYEPATRDYRYDRDNASGEFRFSLRPDGNKFQFAELADDAEELQFGLRMPFSLGKDWQFAGSAGATRLTRDRESGIRRFQFAGAGPDANNPATLVRPIDQILVPANIGPRGFQLREATRSTDNYFAEQTLDAAYLGLDVTWRETVRVNLGMREERNDQSVTTFQVGAQQTPVVARLEATDRLPAGALTWYYSDDAQLRLGYGETLSRPDFRELSQAPFTDPLLDTEVIGNPNLVAASLKNFDLRWEYYFSGSESFTVALFLKEFDKPIEQVQVPGTGDLLSYANAESARNYGVEFDLYKSFDFLHRFDWLDRGWLKGTKWENWYVSGNYAFIESNVELGEANLIQTNQERPLQGQSPYVVNLQFGYLNPESGLEASLVYNRFGQRISNVGVQGLPDIFEDPFNQLDFVYKQNLPIENLVLKARLRNLLDPDASFSQGEEITRLAKKGRELSLALEWKF